MINVAVSKNTMQKNPDLKEHIENLLSPFKRKIFRVTHINTLNDNSIQIFIVNMDNYDKTIIDNLTGYFIFIGDDSSKIIINNNASNNYFIKRPIDFKKLDEILFHIQKKIQNNFIVVQTVEGDYKLKICDLNYIVIEGRALSYHLDNKEVHYSSTLTKSFIKAITPLDQHELLLFIKPSLLINISKIKIIGTNRIVFDNDEWMPVATTQRRIIHDEWTKFHDFDNLYRK